MKSRNLNPYEKLIFSPKICHGDDVAVCLPVSEKISEKNVAVLLKSERFGVSKPKNYYPVGV